MQADVFGIVGSLQAGAFRVEQVVREGGFAVVYRAHHEGFRGDVALKCLKLPGTLNELKQAEFLEKFRAEGELLFRLSAAIPTLVRPLHLGTIKSSKANFVPFIALEWLDGKNLDTFIDERRRLGKAPLGLGRAVQLLGPAARALAQAHEFPGPTGPVSILHRDLKPENLFVVDVHGREMIKILDFGIGKVKGVATQIVGPASLERSSFGAFTPAYGAPEQWLPKRFGQTGTWTDVWGFALTLVELVTATAPLEGDAHAIMGAAIDKRVRPTPRTLGISTSDAAEVIFQRALAVDPKQRYHDIGEFWDQLEAEVGVSNTKLWGGPKQYSSPPGDIEHAAGNDFQTRRARQGEQATALAISIPDLEDDAVSGSGPSSKRPASGRPRAPADLDEFSEVPPDLDADVIPNIGGFRMDAGPCADAIELGSSAGNSRAGADSRPRAMVARTVAVLRPRPKSFLQQLAGPLKLLALAAVIMALDWGYTQVTGVAFQVGPARAFWLAGPLAVLAVVKLLPDYSITEARRSTRVQ